MQTLLLSGMLGTMGAMIMWVVSAASATRAQLLRHDDKLFRPGEL